MGYVCKSSGCEQLVRPYYIKGRQVVKYCDSCLAVSKLEMESSLKSRDLFILEMGVQTGAVGKKGESKEKSPTRDFNDKLDMVELMGARAKDLMEKKDSHDYIKNQELSIAESLVANYSLDKGVRKKKALDPFLVKESARYNRKSKNLKCDNCGVSTEKPLCLKCYKSRHKLKPSGPTVKVKGGRVSNAAFSHLYSGKKK